MRRRWRKKAIYQESAWADHLHQRHQARRRADRQIRNHLRLAAMDETTTPRWTPDEVRRRGAGPVVVRDLWANADSNIVRVADPYTRSHLRKMQRELGAFISPALRQRILARDGRQCRYCGAPAGAVSTVRRRAEGGLLRHFNLVSCCRAHLQHDGRPTLRPVGWFERSERTIAPRCAEEQRRSPAAAQPSGRKPSSLRVLELGAAVCSTDSCTVVAHTSVVKAAARGP